jgi:hypothetical protein
VPPPAELAATKDFCDTDSRLHEGQPVPGQRFHLESPPISGVALAPPFSPTGVILALLDLVEVYIALDIIEVSVVTNLLESAGVEPRVRDMTIGVYPVAVGPLGEKRISVPRAQANLARETLLRAVEDGVLATAERIL